MSARVLRAVWVVVFLGVSPWCLGDTVQWDFDSDLAGTNTPVVLEPIGYPDIPEAPGVTFEEADIGGEIARRPEAVRGPGVGAPRPPATARASAWTRPYWRVPW